MTVLQLKRAIVDLPDDMLVILPKDGEGNGYCPCSGASGEGQFYFPDSKYSGETCHEKDIEESGFDKDDGIPCCVLWPIN